jgi:hypothetical protein
MNLDEGQKKQVAAWIAEGLKLADIQKRIEADFGLRLTYLEARLLMNELQLSPRDQEAKAAPVNSKTIETKTTGPTPAQGPASGAEPAGGGVSVTVDRVTRPGALVSGKASFSDGQSAEWFLDQTGRLGFVPKQQGYRPSETDLEVFQSALQSELQKLGY